MYLGKIVEVAHGGRLYRAPLHPYTDGAAVGGPGAGRRRRARAQPDHPQGRHPQPADPPSGCRFHTRCWLRERLGDPERCATEEPPLAPRDPAQPEPPDGLPLHQRAPGVVDPATLVPVTRASAEPAFPSPALAG